LDLANDVILSHMVTFLNDKTDKHLRASFFDNFVNVAAFVGQQCSPIISPLLQQVNKYKYPGNKYNVFCYLIKCLGIYRQRRICCKKGT